nr:helix-turn-helix transcriptional regulator [Lachnospiraceae bacterium]
MESSEIIFRKNIIYLRLLKEISPYRVSKDLNINMSYYYNLENLRKPINPRFEIFDKLADYYGITVSDLFKPQYSK